MLSGDKWHWMITDSIDNLGHEFYVSQYRQLQNFPAEI